ncbi:mitofusin-1 isoform X6 [Chaetodon trifascialis]|uniref:mitofusin-1 isoform X6 n=1 Tax=Chaetodon trifascialis TaxID=109706 RepID=UPI0039934031
MDAVDPSPLRHFVVAKRSITSIFDQLLDFVKDGSTFVEEAWRGDDLGQVAVEEQSLEMQSCATKLSTIREVLLRRHMKVAFFGRTSNGKSTVINAMLRDRVLPTGIGHTTNCFLRVEGTDEGEAYLTAEASNERKSVSTVNQLAHALHMDPTLDSGSLVKVFWPKSRCALLRDDLVLMDSPGTDVTLELDSWIDKFCLDADVFVLVGNAESTLMNTEKLFFHKVSERISKPNIFILHNRWDASVSEPEYIEEVRKQHLDRCVSFLAEELKVVGLDEAPGRIFFVAAKEVLSSRMQRAQGMPETGEPGGALAEGFHDRLREFQTFERTFEEFISQSAVKAKFEQHTVRAWQITEAIKAVMDAINIASADRKILCLEEREDQRDRLDFVRGQINRLTDNVKERIRTLSDDVAAKVAAALSDQIRSLPVLVDEFRADFNPTQETLQLYKTVWRSVGWRLIALSVSLYGLLYLYEKLTWTNASRERALKQQFVEHATHRLRAVIPVCSSACSQQVYKELSSTFSRLTQRVDLSEAELEGSIRQLSFRIQRLENIQRRSKAFRNRATELETQLEAFSVQYLQGN